MVPKFQVATAGFSCSPPDLKLIKITPVVDATDLIVYQIIDKTIRNSKFRCLSEATPHYNNVFTFTLFLPERRAGVAWEPSNKLMLLLPPQKIKCISLHPLISSSSPIFIFFTIECLTFSPTHLHPKDERALAGDLHSHKLSSVPRVKCSVSYYAHTFSSLSLSAVNG
jgi:hypothetical protein